MIPRRFVILLSLVASVALFAVYLQGRCVKLGYQINREQQRQRMLEDHLKTMKFKVNRERSPEALREKAERYGLKFEEEVNVVADRFAAQMKIAGRNDQQPVIERR